MTPFISTTHAATDSEKLYGIYGHFPLASTRALGVGGAFSGLSDDLTSMIYNPAGSAFGKWEFDFGSSQNLIINREVDIDGDAHTDGVPYRFEFWGVALKMHSLVIGCGKSVPYFAEIKQNSTNTARLSLTSYNLLLAYQLTSWMSLGATYHQETLSELFQHSTYGNWDTQVSGASLTTALSFRPSESVGIGLVHTPRREFHVDPTINNNLGTTVWFRGAVIPAYTTLGFFAKSSERTTFLLDLDLIEKVDNAIYVGSPFEGGLTPDIKSQETRILRGGIEYEIINGASRGAIWRFGAYREPARVVGGFDRMHFTTGLEIRLGILILSASMDQATDFSNSAQGININIRDL